MTKISITDQTMLELDTDSAFFSVTLTHDEMRTLLRELLGALITIEKGQP